jgi:hypothetical protein
MAGPSNSANRFGSSSYVVGTPANGLGNGVNFTSIQAAVNQAVADGFGPANPVDIVIRAGVYTEDVTITDGGISLVGVSDAPFNVLGQQTFINGTISLVITALNQFALSNLFVRGVLGSALTVTGAGSPCRLSADNCAFTGLAAATPGVSFTNASGTFGTAIFTNCSLTSSLAEAHFSSARTISVFFSCNLRGDTNMITLDVSARVQLLYSVGSATTGFGVQFLNAANQVASCRFTTITSGDSIVDMTPGGASTIEQCTFDSSAASGFFITGTGNLVYTDIVNVGTAIDLDPAIGVITVGDWKPYAQVGVGPAPSLGTVRGTSCFDSTAFTVTDGFVELTGGPGASTFPVDNGGPGVPLAGAMSFLGSTSVDFPNPSGIETHVGATTNQIYIEDRRWLSSFIVDPSATVGLRGTFTTIQAALNAIAAGPGLGVIYIKPGTYVESPAIAAGQGIHMIGVQATPNNAAVLIQGQITIGAGSGCGFENLLVGFTAATALSMTNSASLDAVNCSFFSTGSPGVVVNNATAALTTSHCTIQTAALTDALQVFNSTTCVFDDTIFSSGGNTLSLVGTANAQFIYCTFNGVAVLGAGSTGNFQFCNHSVGASYAYDSGPGAFLNAFHETITSNSASTFFVQGTGTFNYADIVNLGTAKVIDPGLIAIPQDWKPYGTTTTVGVNRYNPTDFTVTAATGQVNLVTSGGANSFPTDSGTATPVAGVLNILGGPGVTVSGAGNTVTINSVVYTDRGAGATVTSDSGSFATAAIALTLPAAPAQGEECRFTTTSASALVVTANAGQTIQLSTTVSAVAGTATSTASGDSLWLTYRAANTRWYASNVIGSWTVV